jgi:hypothetical protein
VPTVLIERLYRSEVVEDRVDPDALAACLDLPPP